jgi:N-dimethylarginine dimethylaminohydrolase
MSRSWTGGTPRHIAGAAPLPIIMFLCPPTHYEVAYSINPWMDPTVEVDRVLAWRQWSRFADGLERHGVKLELIEPAPGCPDMVFLGDAGIVLGDQFLCSRFRHPERMAESDHYTRAFGALGYRVIQPYAGAVLEGLGDITIHGRRAILGHGPRSNRTGFDAFRSFAPWVEVIAEVELPDPRFYHLATAVAFLDADTLLFYPGAFTPDGRARLERAVPRAIAVGERDIMEHQACNCFVLGNTVMLDGCSAALERELAACGFRVEVYPMSELKKGGGSLRCLVLPPLQVPS